MGEELDVRSDAGAAIREARGRHAVQRDPDRYFAEKLLVTLDEMTQSTSHRQERDHRSFEEIGEQAGLSVIGNTSSQVKVGLTFRDLEAAGYVERVKDPDGALRYRLTRLGERIVAQHRIAELEAEVARLRRKNAIDA